MTYRGYDILTAVVWMVLGAALVVLGLFLRRPDFGEAIWWVVGAVGVALVVVGVVSIIFTMKQPTEMQCPHCGGRIAPRVKPDTSHLYLAKAGEEERQSAPAAEEEKASED
jgi:DNA-directed RNA polymerase subunit RPC12/RpoP